MKNFRFSFSKKEIRIFLLIGIILPIIATFQNCQEYQLQEEFISQSSLLQNRYQYDVATYQKLLKDSTFAGKYNGTQVIKSGNLISRITNLADTSLFQPSTFHLDQQNSGLTIISGSIKGFPSIEIGTNQFIETSSLDNFVSDQYSISLIAHNTSSGDFLSIHSGSRKTEDIEIQITSTQVQVIQFTTPTDYAVASVTKPNTEWLVIAISAGVSPNDLKIMVNGVISTQVQKTGTTLDSSYVARQLVLAPTIASSTLKLIDLRAYLKALSKYELSVLSRFSAKEYGIKEVYDDPNLRDSTITNPTTPTNPNFAAAQAVIQSKCIGCHSSWSGKNAQFYKSSNLIVAGQPASSLIYICPQTGTRPAACDTMPTVSLSGAELNSLSTWISSEN